MKSAADKAAIDVLMESSKDLVYVTIDTYIK